MMGSILDKNNIHSTDYGKQLIFEFWNPELFFQTRYYLYISIFM